jgi:hypothetical protein
VSVEPSARESIEGGHSCVERPGGRYDIRKARASNIATTTTTTVAVRQTARTLNRTFPSCSTRLILRARERLAARRLAPAPLEVGLLLEGRLELGDALSHSHNEVVPAEEAGWEQRAP